MGTFDGSLSIGERLHNDTASLKTALRKLAAQIRCGLPGIITAFDPSTQLATVQLAVTENVRQNGGGISPVAISPIQHVLMVLPGDSTWCITFPNLVGAECYVCFADMCVNAWWQNGGVQNQEVTRRHDLSDGFAFLAPRSKPNAIPNYSSTALEVRSLDGTVGISMTELAMTLKAPSIVLNGPLSSNETPTASTTPSDHSIPIIISGTTYYMRLSTTP